MTDMLARESPFSRSSRSRSPSVGAIGSSGRSHRKITVIDGNFQSQKDSLERSSSPVGHKISVSPCTSPRPRTPSSGYFAVDTTNPISFLSSGESSNPSLRSRAMTSPTETLSEYSRGHSRGHSDLSSSLTSNGEHMTSLSHSTMEIRSQSPVSWRSSNSSLADTSVSSLIQKPSSDVSVLQDIKRQMMYTLQRTKNLQHDVTQIPKLKNDIEELNREREKHLNELLEHRAMVMQLKQRITLLHEQNQQLVKLAQTDGKGGVSASIIAIRNTLITTLAQLKQMEDQVQSIPGLKNQVRELSDENSRLKEREQQLVRKLPTDLPQCVSSDEYQTIIEENSKLKEINEQLVVELSDIDKHLKAVSEGCGELQKRMELFRNSHNVIHPLQERIKRLEIEKDMLYQELVDSKYHNRTSIDLDTMHLNKKVASLKKANSRLQSKIEQMRLDNRQQKEHLVLKLFEIETLNMKTSRYEIEKQVLEVESLQVSSGNEGITSSPLPSSEGLVPEDVELRNLSPEERLQMVRFKQMEIHNQETKSILQTLMSERQEMESRIIELSSKLNEMQQIDLGSKLEESESKLELANERIKSLESEIRTTRGTSPEKQTGDNGILKEQFEELQKELKRLSRIERDSINVEGKLQDLEQTKHANDKLKADKHKLEKKVKENRHRLKSLAGELSRSADLVRNYQQQCIDMEQEMEKNKEEMKLMREEHASARAEIQVKEFEIQSHVKTGTNGAAATTVEAGILSELQDKYSQLSKELASFTERHELMTTELRTKEDEICKLTYQVTSFSSSEKEMKTQNEQLTNKLKELEIAAKNNEQTMEELSKNLSDKTKISTEMEIQLSELQHAHQKVNEDFKVSNETVESLKTNLKRVESEKQSLQQKVEILSSETPALVQQATELRVSKDEAERNLASCLANHKAAMTKVTEVEEKLKSSEKLCREYRSKLRLLQADLDEAESKLDSITTTHKELNESNLKLKEEVTEMQTKLRKEEQEVINVRQQLDTEKTKRTDVEKELNDLSLSLDSEKKHCKEIELEMEHMKNEELPKLHSELAKTVSEMGQLTTDYSSRVGRVRELEMSYQQVETDKQELTQKLRAAEKEVNKVNETCDSLKMNVKKKEEEVKDLKTSQTTVVTQSQKLSDEIKKLKAEVSHYQTHKQKQDKQISGMKEESSNLREQLKINHARVSDVQKTLNRKEEELRKACDDVAVQAKELENMKKKLRDYENQCEMLTATRDNLLRRLDRMEKLEMDYESLKHKVQDILGQSSQLKNDNKALLQLLEGVETEMPSFEKEATRNLQEENVELQQQVSLLSQWNDKHQRNITSLEQQIEAMEDEKRQLLVELMQLQSHEQENKLLKKELGEVEVEVNRLKRQAHAELQEEMKVKVETQSQLLSIFNEHNKALQIQVGQLQKQIRDLGGKLTREKPVSPPPMPEPSEIMLFATPDARRCAELEVMNGSLQQQIGRLEAELISAQEISPRIRRRSSALLAASSIPWVPSNEEAFISVPDEMLLPCSMLADAFINKTELPTSLMQSYLKTIGEGWFGAVAQKTITASSLGCYTTTFSRLSSELLKIIVNMQDMRGNTALHHSLANSNFPVVSVLLDVKCCNPNLTNKAGYTPLMLAAAHNIQCGEHKPIMQKLLSMTDVNIKSKVELQTALMLAVSSGSLELVSMFLESGSDINSQDKDGSTSLMFACEKGHLEIVQKLLSNHSCDITIKDNDGQSAYDIASSYSHTQICNLLKKHKKQISKRK